MSQYPADFQPPHRGRCKWTLTTGPVMEMQGLHVRGITCDEETRAYAPQWLHFCPRHWQLLERTVPLGKQQLAHALKRARS